MADPVGFKLAKEKKKKIAVANMSRKNLLDKVELDAANKIIHGVLNFYQNLYTEFEKRSLFLEFVSIP